MKQTEGIHQKLNVGKRFEPVLKKNQKNRKTELLRKGWEQVPRKAAQAF